MDPFQQAEEEFFKLRGQFAVGRISAEEFDAALKALQVQDAEGRIWMIGANTGRWYYTRPQWVQGDPVPDAAALPDNVPPENEPVMPAGAEPAEDVVAAFANVGSGDGALARALKKIVLVFFAIAAALVIGAVLFSAINGNTDLLAGAILNATPTRILPRAAEVLPAANPPPPMPTLLAQGATATPLGTRVRFAPTPGLVLEPTSTEPALTVIPTITPNPIKTRQTTESLSTLPPAVYVTNIRVSPNPPPRGSAVTFTASFFNTNRESVPMNWRVILLDPGKEGRNRDYGESPFVGITVPPGRTDFSITFMPVKTGGTCMTLQVLAARRRDDNSRELLRGTTGNPFAVNVTFC